MPVHFACPHCGEQTLVDEQFAGQTGPCINCGRPIVVPIFSSEATQAGAGSPTSASRPAMRTYWPLMILVSLAGLGALTGIAILVSSLLQPAIQAARANNARKQCARNLRQIGAAMLAYEADYGTLPPAYLADEKGTPLHSWRVLILPYLGEQEKRMYQRYDFNCPWNSAQNAWLSGQMPEVFACPADPNALAMKETSYLVFVGKGTMFPGAKANRRSAATDGLEQTILVVECRGTGIGWLEPKDLTGSMSMYQIGVDLGGNHAGGMNALMASGTTEFLPVTMPSEHVRALVTPNGQEPNPLELLD
jgi:hypothetical protein